MLVNTLIKHAWPFPILVSSTQNISSELTKWQALIHQCDGHDAKTVVAHLATSVLVQTSLVEDWYVVAKGHLPGIYKSQYVFLSGHEDIRCSFCNSKDMSRAIANLSDKNKKFKKCGSFAAALLYLVTNGSLVFEGNPNDMGDWTPSVGNLPRATSVPPPASPDKAASRTNSGGTANPAAYIVPPPAVRYQRSSKTADGIGEGTVQ